MKKNSILINLIGIKTKKAWAERSNCIHSLDNYLTGFSFCWFLSNCMFSFAPMPSCLNNSFYPFILLMTGSDVIFSQFYCKNINNEELRHGLYFLNWREMSRQQFTLLNTSICSLIVIIAITHKFLSISILITVYALVFWHPIYLFYFFSEQRWILQINIWLMKKLTNIEDN